MDLHLLFLCSCCYMKSLISHLVDDGQTTYCWLLLCSCWLGDGCWWKLSQEYSFILWKYKCRFLRNSHQHTSPVALFAVFLLICFLHSSHISYGLATLCKVGYSLQTGGYIWSLGPSQLLWWWLLWQISRASLNFATGHLGGLYTQIRRRFGDFTWVVKVSHIMLLCDSTNCPIFIS